MSAHTSGNRKRKWDKGQKYFDVHLILVLEKFRFFGEVFVCNSLNTPLRHTQGRGHWDRSEC